MASLEFVTEQEVGELGPAVGHERVVAVAAVQVVNVDADRSAAEKRRPVAFGVDIDDPAGTAGQQGQELAGHRVRREVVDGEVQLGAFAGGLPRGHHHASVVNKRVEVIGGVADLAGGAVDARAGGYVCSDDDGAG